MEKNEIINMNAEDIKQLIHTIRGKQVMLDSDVARLFKYQTKDLNRNVKNNIERFPDYYCFQLTNKEYESLRCKIFTLKNSGRGQHRKYLPFVFTEYGITMLAGLLRSDIAIATSIKIVNSFIEMKRMMLATGQTYERLVNLEYKVLEHDNMFKNIMQELGKEESIKQRLFYEGQIWDSYNLIVNIIKKADNKILIIDNYIDDSILEMLSKKKKEVEVVILTSENSRILKLDIKKFNSEYPILKVIKSNKFHDRFIIIDNKELYHLRCIIKGFR